jgi:hypothetical protein
MAYHKCRAHKKWCAGDSTYQRRGTGNDDVGLQAGIQVPEQDSPRAPAAVGK